MKRFMVIGDRIGDKLPDDFAVLWIGNARDKDDAIKQHSTKHKPKSYEIYKVIEISKEHENPAYHVW
ncbi:MAG: hypothetical protein GF334_09590 [Candidatus Altiarchaeales archaeon]|nr:hypothetical protein [Candidatus Altiarchaeales archaeon]